MMPGASGCGASISRASPGVAFAEECLLVEGAALAAYPTPFPASAGGGGQPWLCPCSWRARPGLWPLLRPR